MSRQSIRTRSPEIAALFNPALITLLLVRSTRSYQNEIGESLPLVYAPIIATVSLYPEARSTLSMNVATKFATWIDRSSHLQSLLREKIVDMVPTVNEGVLFALLYNALQLREGGLAPGDVRLANSIRADTEDVATAQRVAAYLGRWLPRAGSPATVCAMLGVAP
jgi:ABC-3C biological conflict system middle component